MRTLPEIASHDGSLESLLGVTESLRSLSHAAVFLKMLKCVKYCWMVSTGDQVSDPLVMMWLGAVLSTQLPRKP